ARHTSSAAFGCLCLMMMTVNPSPIRLRNSSGGWTWRDNLILRGRCRDPLSASRYNDSPTADRGSRRCSHVARTFGMLIRDHMRLILGTSVLLASLLSLRAAPADLDAAFARFWSAKDPSAAAKASNDIVKSGAAFEVVYDRLKRGRP